MELASEVQMITPSRVQPIEALPFPQASLICADAAARRPTGAPLQRRSWRLPRSPRAGRRREQSKALRARSLPPTETGWRRHAGSGPVLAATVVGPASTLRYVISGMIRIATMFATLIMG